MASFLIKFSLLIIIFLPLCVFAQNKGIVAVGRILTAGKAGDNLWLSQNGDFGFGFKQLQTTTNQDEFLLCIWYDKIPDKTVVWYANSSVAARRGSRVELNGELGLVITDPAGRLLWKTDLIQTGVAYGILEDTGNFVVVASFNNTLWLWESFKHPTDTLLPTQELEIGGVLISRRSETNFSPGRFYLRMLENGNVVLDPNTTFVPEYYNSLTSDSPNTSNSGFKLVFNESAYMYILKKNGETKEIGSTSPSVLVSTSDYYHRVTLAFDGVLTQYYYPRNFSNNPNWTFLWSQPDNICTSFVASISRGVCGYNSICGLGDDQKPVCQCPKRYSLLDPSDEYGSCKPDFDLGCNESVEGSPDDLYDFEPVIGYGMPNNDYEMLESLSEADCRNNCLHDCFCAVALYNENRQCWKKRMPFSFGRIQSPDVKALLKYRKLPFAEGPITKNDRGNLILVISVLLGGSVFINLLLIAGGCLGFFLNYQKKIMKLFPGNNFAEINLRCFTFKELEEATNGFKEEPGRGAFGIVYKGVIQVGSSSSAVAVKKLDRVAQETEKEFKTEVNAIGKIHHKNLVPLIGFCDEGQNRLLVYEYMSNFTLASFLFGDLKPSWTQRIIIAQGIARGLTYLHEECSTQIIHCDIKPQNILLDDYYNARISDFGLAKLLMITQSRTDTGIRGTKGYVAPEWFRHVPISAKVDVYSFGVLLLEIITCRKSIEKFENVDEDKAILTDWGWDCFQEGRLVDLVGDDTEALDDWKKLERFVKVCIWCIQEDSSNRPTMRKVSQMLEGVVEVTNPPSPLLFSTVI